MTLLVSQSKQSLSAEIQHYVVNANHKGKTVTTIMVFSIYKGNISIVLALASVRNTLLDGSSLCPLSGPKNIYNKNNSEVKSSGEIY